ncbi:MAG: alpha/beta fold hydrolase [Ardenticatenaceae bacterium]|nr:alpha/beta fold hydrolase [Ardenticatenaceae bacterium]
MKLELISHHPPNPQYTTPLLFVHGAWHGAWCWENFLPYFAQQGYEAHALSLRGHGQSQGHERLRWHSSHDYVADVAHIAQTLAAPPVVIGHSMGGYVVQKYLEAHPAPAAVLLASIPVSGILGFGLRLLRRHPWPFIKANLILNPWHMIGTPSLAQDAFFSPHLPAAEVSRHFARLQSESFRLEMDAMLLNLPKPQRVQTPLLVLAAANDTVFTVKEEEATAKAYGTTAVIFPNMAHDMMLEPGWQSVADHILNWLSAQEIK